MSSDVSHRMIVLACIKRCYHRVVDIQPPQASRLGEESPDTIGHSGG